MRQLFILQNNESLRSCAGLHESFNFFSHPNSTNTKLWYFDIYTTKLVTCIYENKNYELFFFIFFIFLYIETKIWLLYLLF